MHRAPPAEARLPTAVAGKGISSLRRLGKNTFLFGLSALLGRAISFLMLPVYTRYLSPSDYGLLAILVLAVEVTELLLSAGAAAGLMRFYYKAVEESHRHEVLFTAWATTASLHLAGAGLLAVAAPWIWRVGLDGAGTVGMVRLAAATFAVSGAMLVPMEALIVDQRPAAFAAATIAKLIIQLSCNILYVVVLEAGPIGILWGTLWSGLAVGTIVTALMLRRTGFAWNWETFRNLRRFSIPIQVSKVGTFFLAYGDRFFLQRFSGLSTVGLYGLAYQFGFLISGVCWSPFLQAWQPQRFQLTSHPRAHRDELYNRAFLYGSIAVVGGAVAISLFIRPVLEVMTTREFHSAATFVPIIVLAYVFQCWCDAAEFGISVSERTKYTSVATWISVAAVGVLYLILIPRFGGLGAAVATLVGMVIRFIATLRFAQRLWPVSYRWGPHLSMLAAGILAVSATVMVPAQSLLSRIIAGVIGMVAWLAWVWAGVLHLEDRVLLRRLMLHPSEFRSLIS